MHTGESFGIYLSWLCTLSWKKNYLAPFCPIWTNMDNEESLNSDFACTKYNESWFQSVWDTISKTEKDTRARKLIYSYTKYKMKSIRPYLIYTVMKDVILFREIRLGSYHWNYIPVWPCTSKRSHEIEKSADKLEWYLNSLVPLLVSFLGTQIAFEGVSVTSKDVWIKWAGALLLVIAYLLLALWYHH